MMGGKLLDDHIFSKRKTSTWLVWLALLDIMQLGVLLFGEDSAPAVRRGHFLPLEFWHVCFLTRIEHPPCVENHDLCFLARIEHPPCVENHDLCFLARMKHPPCVENHDLCFLVKMGAPCFLARIEHPPYLYFLHLIGENLAPAIRLPQCHWFLARI